MLPVQKISISVSLPLYEFVERYKAEKHCKNRSEVINQALQLLQLQALEASYKEASKEVDIAFENTTFDGLNDDETW